MQDKSAFRNTLGGQFTKHGKHVIMKREGRVLAVRPAESGGRRGGGSSHRFIEFRPTTHTQHTPNIHPPTRGSQTLVKENETEAVISLPNVSRRVVAEITDGLVPALQARGLARKAYSHEQFRDNLLEY